MAEAKEIASRVLLEEAAVLVFINLFWFLESVRTLERLSTRDTHIQTPIRARNLGAEVHGKIKWSNNAKGYGFIGRDDRPDVFVHYSAIEAHGYRTRSLEGSFALNEGDAVEFEIVEGPKGHQAANVARVSLASRNSLDVHAGSPRQSKSPTRQ